MVESSQCEWFLLRHILVFQFVIRYRLLSLILLLFHYNFNFHFIFYIVPWENKQVCYIASNFPRQLSFHILFSFLCSFNRCYSSDIKLFCKEHYIRTPHSKNILAHRFRGKTKTRFFNIFELISIFKKFKRGSVHFCFSSKCCQDIFVTYLSALKYTVLSQIHKNLFLQTFAPILN